MISVWHVYIVILIALQGNYNWGSEGNRDHGDQNKGSQGSRRNGKEGGWGVYELPS